MKGWIKVLLLYFRWEIWRPLGRNLSMSCIRRRVVRSSETVRIRRFSKCWKDVLRTDFPCIGEGGVHGNRDSEASVLSSFYCCRMLNSKHENSEHYQSSLKVEHVPEYVEQSALTVGRLWINSITEYGVRCLIRKLQESVIWKVIHWKLEKVLYYSQ